MPVLRISTSRLIGLLGGLVRKEDLGDLLFKVKCEAEEVEPGVLEVEVNSDRPDMFIAEGIARALKGIMGLELGMPRYEVGCSDFTCHVGDVVSRPYIAIAVVRDVRVDEEYLKELVQFQEKLHQTLGRNRRKVAIGLHDLSKVPSTELRYELCDINEVKFVPLGYEEEMPLRDVLQQTEQGKKYGSISLYGSKHPVIFSGNDVISVPPVINAELTRVEPGTRDLLIDVTGSSLEAVIKTMDILVCNMAERGGRIERAEIVAPWGCITTPVLSVEERLLSTKYVNEVLGLELSSEEVAFYLEAMRFEARPMGGYVRVKVPPFRVDVLHDVDLVEDVAIGLGYDRIPLEEWKPRPPGRLLSKWRFINAVRDVMCGLGFQEVLSFMLCSSKDMTYNMRLEDAKLVRIENPVSLEMDAVRCMLLPQLLRMASRNQHVEMPVKVFEVGDVVEVDEEEETCTKTKTHLACLIMGPAASFEDVQGSLYALLRSMGLAFKLRRASHPSFIEGRCAEIAGEGFTAILGEVHPEVLERFGIEYPVAAAEIDFTNLVKRF